LKVENDRVISWQLNARSDDGDQIDIFNSSGGPFLSLNPLRAVDGSKLISISDVAVGASGTIVAAVDAVSSDGRIAPCLLVYGATGQLLHAFGLPAHREVMRVELDENDEIWALGVGTVFDDPSEVPVIFAYDTTGNIVHEFLRRSQFPKEIPLTQEGPSHGGNVSFGLAADKVWFFLPASGQLVIVKRDGSSTQIVNTGLPNPADGASSNPPVRALCTHASLLPSGRFLLQMNFETKSSVRNELFEWDTSEREWVPLPLEGIVSEHEMFFGGDDSGLSFATPKGSLVQLRTVAGPHR
jgi:hypothetical protein